MAARYWVGGTANWDGTAGSKWSLTSGGAGGQAVPTSADDVFINDKNAPNWAALTSYTLAVIRSPLATANGFFYEVTTAGISGAIEPTWPTTVGNTVTDGTITWTCRKANVTLSNASCLRIVFTGYSGTFTRTGSLTVGSGGITLGSSMILAGSGQLTLIASCTLVANSVLWNAPLATFNNIILTFSDSWQVTNITIGIVTQVQLNGVGINLYVSGNYNAGIGGGYQTSGTINMILNGTGGVLSGDIAHNLEVNSTGAITQSSFGFFGSGKTYKVTAFGTYSASSCIMTIGGTPTIDLGTTPTGRVLGGLTIATGNVTANIVNDIYIGSYYQFITQSAFNTSTGSKVYVSTSLQLIGTGWALGGNVDFIINGDCTWSGTGSVGVNLEINAPSSNVTVTFTGQFYNSKTLKYTSALTFSAGSSNISFGSSFGTLTLDLGSSLWGSFTMVSTSTVTIIGNANFTGNITSNLFGNNYIINGGNLNIGGNFTASSSGAVGGTATLVFNRSTPTVISSTVEIRMNLSINKSGGASVTNVSSFSFTTGKVWNYTAGSVNMGTSTITFGSGSIINSAGMSFFNITIPAGASITINSSLSITGTLALSGGATFAGTHGWTCGTLSCSVPGCIITLQQAITYITTTNAIMLGTNAAKILMRSNDLTIPYVLAKWTLANTPAAQSMTYVSATAIDSSEGMTIWSFGGIIDSSTINWGLGASQGTKAFTFVS